MFAVLMFGESNWTWMWFVDENESEFGEIESGQITNQNKQQEAAALNNPSRPKVH